MDGQDAVVVSNGSAIGHGDVANRLLAGGMNVGALRTLSTLRKDEWKQYDEVVVQIARDTLRAAGDLINAGLVYNLNNAMGKLSLEWEKVSDMNDADVSMSAVTDGGRDRVVFEMDRLPVPIIHKEFQLNARTLAASRQTGQSLDTIQAEVATRKVAERLERIVFDGYGLGAGGGDLYGYTNFPHRNTGAISNWALTATTGDTILADVLKMIAALVGDFRYGPYVLYVPTDYYLRLLGDFKAASDKSIMARLLEIPQLSAIRPTNYLTGGASGEVVLVQMTRDVVDMVIGQQPVPVMWDTHGGFMMNFKVLAIMFPRLKADYNGSCGIAHYTVQ